MLIGKIKITLNTNENKYYGLYHKNNLYYLKEFGNYTDSTWDIPMFNKQQVLERLNNQVKFNIIKDFVIFN